MMASIRSAVWPALVACGMALAGSDLVTAQSTDLPTYDVRRATEPITVDGVLDEATWAMSPRVGPLRLIHDPARRPVFPTEASMVWDDAHLYVSFACVDPEPWGTLKRFDDRLWNEEVVEVFLDPDGDGQNYAEFEVSPDNVLVDLLIPAPKTIGRDNRAWNAEGWKTAVKRHASGWVVEMAIPWRSLGATGTDKAPAPGDRWRVGLYRIERPGGAEKSSRIAALVDERRSAAPERRGAIDKELEQLRANDEYSAWSVTRPDIGFHDPERFGYVTFR